MSYQFSQAGDTLDHAPEADVATGDTVVIGDLVAVAFRPIPAGTLGAVALVGIHKGLPKDATAAVTAGAKAYFDATAKKYTPTATDNKLAGYFTEDAAEAATECSVLLRQ